MSRVTSVVQAVFLDRDGTLIENRHYLAAPEGVEVPITFTDRTHGASKADFAETRRSIGDLLRLARRTWLGW